MLHSNPIQWNEPSVAGKIACSVPQGSVLRPLLFIIYINDLPNVFKFLSFFLFADDTNIYYESDGMKTICKYCLIRCICIKQIVCICRLIKLKLLGVCTNVASSDR